MKRRDITRDLGKQSPIMMSLNVPIEGRETLSNSKNPIFLKLKETFSTIKNPLSYGGASEELIQRPQSIARWFIGRAVLRVVQWLWRYSLLFSTESLGSNLRDFSWYYRSVF
ncbi:hypothetical protein HAX54_013379 [Datura stramonium]|uniref:Uncharacterized protein n=1 Tax=Datura stramonium TaxID=4076 RepID=A0ABS8TN17_DATST|nr:hypothetical protein [Datura stramonium]